MERLDEKYGVCVIFCVQVVWVCVCFWNEEGIRLINMKKMVTSRKKCNVCVRVRVCLCVYVFGKKRESD